MPAIPSRARPGFAEVLAAELAPREGRWAAVTRIAVATSLTVAVAMIFRIPEPAYMAYVVFLISRDDRGASVLAALGGLAAATLAVLVTLTLSLVDLGEPAVRIPAMTLATFLAMYTMRTLALGQLTFLAGFVIVLLQSLIDDVPAPEVFTRATLWVWVVVAVPVAITVVMQAVFGHDIEVTLRRALRKVLRELKQGLLRDDFQRDLPRWRGILVPLLDAKRDAANALPGRIGDDALPRLAQVLSILEVVPASVPGWRREAWAAQVDACLGDLDRARAQRVEARAEAKRDETTASPAEVAAGDGLRLLQAAIADGARPPAPGERGKRGPFVADAFTNPSHWQFALKATAAVMVSYAIYTLLDWPGIRTAMVTCFFVALGSLGETVHKLVLRLSGAVIGGVLAALCIVFVLPSLTDIGQLCLLIAFVSLGAAWIATSSELLAYMGLQIAFAFFLGVLQGYAPATDLTVLRDRVAGILLGNVVITIVFSSLWPESAATRLRGALAEVLRSLGAILKGQAGQLRTGVVRALASADRFRTLSALELRMLAPATRDGTLPGLEVVERLAGATFVATAAPVDVEKDRDVLAKVGDWMEAAADRVAGGLKLPDIEFDGASAVPPAVEQLRAEIRHVTATNR